MYAVVTICFVSCEKTKKLAGGEGGRKLNDSKYNHVNKIK